MESEIIVSGYGGQGVLFAGTILAYAAVIENKYATWIPAYGPEMRGGTANCSVIISNEEIASPFAENPTGVIVLNTPSASKFEEKIQPGGVMVVNMSLVIGEPERDDITYLLMPLSDLAVEAGDAKFANIVGVGAFVEKTGIVSIESVKFALEKILSVKRKHLLSVNYAALEKGADYVRKEF